MPLRRVMTACVAVLVMSMMPFRLHADDRTMLIELEARAPAFTSGGSASGAVVAGGLLGGGGFYWMPTTGVIFKVNRRSSTATSGSEVPDGFCYRW